MLLESVMGRQSADVTEAELAVLEALWERGPSTVKELTAELYPRDEWRQPATVLKLLERLEAKKCVRRRRARPAHLFQARVSRDDLISRRLDAVADRLCGGSRSPLLMHLVDPGRLTAEEIRTLRALIDEIDQQTEAMGNRS